MMITFKTVEDYIEVIAGERDMVTLKPTSNWLSEPIISLARYDTDVVAKMATQTLSNIGYTDKQAKLAQKIVLTYKRQLAQKNIDVSPVENPVYRIPLREMDYGQRLYIENDMLCLKFPYNQKLIEMVRGFGKESQGTSGWDPNKKVWAVALTEYNLNWLHTFAEVNKFEIDTEVTELFKKVSDVESAGYSICLTISDGEVEIKNAPTSLLEYITTVVGDLTPENLLKLVDLAPILGYDVDDDIVEALAKEYGYRFVHLMTNRELKLDPATMLADNNFDSVIDYAISMDRLPVYVYEPDLSGRLLKHIKERFNTEEYVEYRNSSKEISEKTKVVHIIKPVRNKIPLLVSSAGMIYGGEKEFMIQNSEKIVYCAAEVYNRKNNNGVKSLAS